MYNRQKLIKKSTNRPQIKQHRPNIDQKSTKNRPKINQNQPRIDQKSTKNRGLEGSGAGLEASWAVLGDPKRLWRHLGPSWRHLGGVLEASWAVLGRERWPTWVQLGFQNGAKIDSKSTQTLLNFMMSLGIDNFRLCNTF